jgi:hypothetical protein
MFLGRWVGLAESLPVNSQVTSFGIWPNALLVGSQVSRLRNPIDQNGFRKTT